MRARTNPGSSLVRLATEQDGVVTREQFLASGLSDDSAHRLVRSGRWQRMARGVYFTESVDPTWRALAWAGVLLGGDEARLGGLAAGHLHGVVADPPTVITVRVPHGAPRSPRGPWEFIQERSDVRRRSRGEPPRIDLEDSVLDLCEGASAARVADLIARAVQTRRTTPDRLLRRLEERSRHSRRMLLLGMLADVEAGAESPLELRYLNEVERPHRLPRGNRQYRTRGTACDVYYEEFALVVELDGRAGHEANGRHRDMGRDNRSTLAGAATLRYGWWDVVEDPCSVARQVATVLAGRGWTGSVASCSRCWPTRSDGACP